MIAYIAEFVIGHFYFSSKYFSKFSILIIFFGFFAFSFDYLIYFAKLFLKIISKTFSFFYWPLIPKFVIFLFLFWFLSDLALIISFNFFLFILCTSLPAYIYKIWKNPQFRYKNSVIFEIKISCLLCFVFECSFNFIFSLIFIDIAMFAFKPLIQRFGFKKIVSR